MIKAVIFDVDGVLIDSFEANLRFFISLIRAAGYTPPTRKEYKKMFHLSMEDVIKKVTQLKSKKEIKRIWEMGKYKINYPSSLIKIPNTAESIIKELSKKYLLGIVTSRVKGGLFKIKRIDVLEKYFHTVIYFEDTKEHKPHPEPLLLASKKLKIKPSECVYIGDAETDMQAAKAAGMKMIFYTKNFESLPKLIEAFK